MFYNGQKTIFRAITIRPDTCSTLQACSIYFTAVTWSFHNLFTPTPATTITPTYYSILSILPVPILYYGATCFLPHFHMLPATLPQATNFRATYYLLCHMLPNIVPYDTCSNATSYPLRGSTCHVLLRHMSCVTTPRVTCYYATCHVLLLHVSRANV